jgi:hypothetical protein
MDEIAALGVDCALSLFETDKVFAMLSCSQQYSVMTAGSIRLSLD